MSNILLSSVCSPLSEMSWCLSRYSSSFSALLCPITIPKIVCREKGCCEKQQPCDCKYLSYLILFLLAHRFFSSFLSRKTLPASRQIICYCSHVVRPATHLAILNRLWRWGEMHSSQNMHPPCQSAE